MGLVFEYFGGPRPLFMKVDPTYLKVCRDVDIIRYDFRRSDLNHAQMFELNFSEPRKTLLLLCKCINFYWNLLKFNYISLYNQ